MPTPAFIVQCLRRDLDGDLLAGARYAESISATARTNPFGDPSDHAHYAEAARRLRAEHAESLPDPRPSESICG